MLTNEQIDVIREWFYENNNDPCLEYVGISRDNRKLLLEYNKGFNWYSDDILISDIIPDLGIYWEKQ